MNYRHSFHAGNFADLVKHALLLWLIEQAQAEGPVAVVDTHAGAGLYALGEGEARSREAMQGVDRLMGAESRPALIAALAEAVSAVNAGGAARLYPGSPALAGRRLRAEDRYVGFELREDVAGSLGESLADYPQALGRLGDGFSLAPGAVREARAAGRRSLVLIDPPFERADDYLRSAETVRALLAADPGAVVAVWTPLKDLETLDGFLRRLDGLSVLVAEARLRPLTNPMKMNGCAVVLINPPEGAEAAATEICGWVAETLGDGDASAPVWRA